MSDYSKIIAELSPEKRELLEMLLLEEAGGPDSFPLSFAQQRLWFIDRLEPNSHLYNVCTNVRLQGRLDAPALARSFEEIVRRHEALRTTFRLENREPVQVIAESVTITPALFDLEPLPAAEREGEVRRLLAEEARLPFDLSQGPLLRVKLLRLSDEEHVLLLTMHHIISDGWSLGVLVREIAALYGAYTAGEPSPLQELPVQYADFVLWQRETMQGETLESDLRYWKEQLAGAPAVLELPTDRPRPAVNSYRGAKQPFALPADLSAAVKDFAEREGATLYMVMLAAFQTLLHRYAGQEDIVVGTPIANRNRAETEALIGFFVNTLALRADFHGDPTFTEMLGRTREAALGAYAHQDLPFEKLVEELQPERSLSHTPLFQVVFVLQNAPLGSLELPGLKLTPLGGDSGTAKFDLTLFVEESERGLVGGMEYNTDLFDAATVERMLGHYENLLRGLVARPDRRVSELPLLTEAEHRLLMQWNPTNVVHPVERTLHEVFETQAARTPGAVALTFGSQQLTYSELNSRANQLAHHLRALGVGPESRVGVMLERSPLMLVALLGILKAGGAYVPLDPHYPADRLSFMLEDAGVKAVLTESGLLHMLPGRESQAVCLDTDWAEIASAGDENPVSEARPENLAYIIYTSGSTGRPKGVTVTHGNVLRLFSATDEWFNFGERDVWTLFHSYAFDFSVWELWGALLYGGRLVVVPYMVSRSPEAFYRLLVDERVTVLNQTPSAFRQLMQAEEGAGGGPGDTSLRVVVFGGEALELQSLRPWFERHGDASPLLVNMYGITETTVHVTYRPLSMADVEAGVGSRIGVPIPDLQSYVLDGHMRPVPVGVAGELYVGGGGVARGYLGRAALTATRFVPHPFSERPGERLYRTGDRARYTPNGDLEYLGRIDHQVKVRGFRIELGEIEAVLSAHAAVREAIVLAREDAPGEKRLVAYLVVDPSAPPAVAELRGFLKERLPDYMVPSAFVTLDELPLTNHGKVDRKRLPAPDSSRPELEREYVAPRTQAEETLCAVWAEVLGVERVGIHDNYFELGGDSIRSVGLLALAKERGLDFSLQQLFQHQTVYELAKEIEAAEGEGRAESTPDTRTEPFELVAEEDLLKLPAGLDDAYPLTMMQAGMLFHSEYSPDSSVYHNVTSFRLRARFDEAALRTALRHLLERHPVLRTSFDLTSYSEPLQLVYGEVELPLRVEDLRALPAPERAAALAASFDEEKAHKFDWRRAPLIRLLVQRDGEESCQITLTEHHAILDGWSVALLLSELFRDYFSLLDDSFEPAGQSPLSSSFRDFVRLEQAAVRSEESRDFWRERLSDSVISTLPSLPEEGGERGAQQLRTVQVSVSHETSEGLKALAQSTGVPLKSVLLAAHLRVMSVVSGQHDVLTGVISHGRPEGVDGERVAGLFLNTLPFRLKLTGGTWAELVEETFEAELEMLPHRRYPLAQIQNEQGHSLLETFFNFINFHVYDGLANSGRIETAGTKNFADTNFPFSVEFSLDLRTNDVTLGLFSGETSDLTGEQLKAIGVYYSNALKSMGADPFSRYESQSLLAPEERQQLLEDWNRTAQPYDRAACLHQLFEAQAARTPDSVALVRGSQQLTYAELNRQANRLAHHLRALGVGAESRVGVMLTRTPRVLVSLLGVLKAGGAYVPLDPSYPADRLSFMLGDADVKVLLTESALLPTLPPHDAALLCLDADIDWDASGDENPACNARPENLAYVIYTSGSTGRPKGVAIAHRSAVAFLDWSRSFFSEEELSAVLASTSINFDLSVFELFAPLAVGGSVLLAENALELPSLECADGVKMVNTVPSAMAELVRQGAVPASVRTVNLAGEALPRKLVQAIYEGGSVGRVVNLYGPSEDTTYTTWEVVADAPGSAVLIGRPVANTRVYILDARMEPVPVGVGGELYTAGEGLARGYLNRPSLTAEKFIPDPFSPQPGGRMYRTGDVARFLADGRIEYLGRIDHQVKVRGFRIELGEIEAALERHEGVERAVVTVKGEGGEARLVAYVAAKAGGGVSGSELRASLKAGLPEYMVPQAFVVMGELPLTPNGKVDRKRLPEPEPSGLAGEGEYAAPRTQVEEVLCGIWAGVLGLGRVGVDDNFFDLGGQSILATQVITRAREAFQIEIPLRSLFNAPTPAGLAESVEAMLRDREGVQLPPLGRTPRGGELPLSFAQQRLWFLDQWNPGSAAYNITEAVRLTGRLDVPTLERTFNEIVRRHESLRTTFPSVEGRAVQTVAPSLTLPLPVLDLTGLPADGREAEARRLAQEEAGCPFDLSQGPLVRATLLKLSGEEHMLLFNMHHIISDGWSMGVLVNEVAALYAAFLEGRPSPLEELPVQYADFAHWQREWLQGPALASQLDYWKRQLSGAPSQLDLPLDRPRPARQTFLSAKLPVVVPEPLTDELKSLSRRAGSTLFMTLLAAYNVVLRRHSGSDDIVVGTDVANRNRFEVEGLIGFFINQLVLRTRLDGDPTFEGLLGRVREATLGAYAHQDMPFDRLVESLKVERSLQYSPLFQVKFAFLNAPASALELPGLAVEVVGINSGTTGVDLQLTLTEVDGALRGWLEYNSQLFDAATVARLGGDLLTLLEKVASRPSATLSELDQSLGGAVAAARPAEPRESKESVSLKLKAGRRKAVNAAPTR